MTKRKKYPKPRTIKEVQYLIRIVERLRFNPVGFDRLVFMAHLYCEEVSGDLMDSAWILSVDDGYVTYGLFGRRTFTRKDFLSDKHVVIDGLRAHIVRLQERNRATYVRRRNAFEAERCTPSLFK